MKTPLWFPQSFFSRTLWLVLVVVLFSKALTLVYLMMNEDVLVDRQYSHGAALTLRAYWAADPEDRATIAEAAGLKPVVVDVESYASRLATARLIENLPNKGLDTLVALFEVGALTTSMQVIKNDEVLYERDQAFGGAQLTQLIVRQYGFSPEEAESKKRSGDLPEDYGASVLKPFVDSMAQEIGRALQFFFTSTPHNKVDYVMLAGGSSALPGLTEAVTQQTSFACMVANPFEGMVLGSNIREKKMRREASSYQTSCGLALRRFFQ